MPAGPGELGYAYFAGVKFIGYSAYCRFALQRKQKAQLPDASPVAAGSLSSGQADTSTSEISPWIAGAVRTAIGIVVGAVVGVTFWKIPFFAHRDNLDELLFFSLLVPVRVGEWWLLMRIFYKGLLQHRTLAIIMIIAGILVSFGLDALGVVAAWILPGGMWVC